MKSVNMHAYAGFLLLSCAAKRGPILAAAATLQQTSNVGSHSWLRASKSSKGPRLLALRPIKLDRFLKAIAGSPAGHTNINGLARSELAILNSASHNHWLALHGSSSTQAANIKIHRLHDVHLQSARAAA